MNNNFSYYKIAKHHLKMPTCFNSITAIFREFGLKLNECITAVHSYSLPFYYYICLVSNLTINQVLKMLC